MRTAVNRQGSPGLRRGRAEVLVARLEVLSERGPEAAALMRVPHNVILTHASNEAVQVLAEDLGRAGLPVPGVGT